MINEKTKITVKSHGNTYTLEGDFIDIDDWVEVFSKVLYNVDFNPETIKEAFGKQ